MFVMPEYGLKSMSVCKESESTQAAANRVTFLVSCRQGFGSNEQGHSKMMTSVADQPSHTSVIETKVCDLFWSSPVCLYREI